MPLLENACRIGLLGLALSVVAPAHARDAAQPDAPAPAVLAPAPMDVVWETRDANRFPNQPIWGLQHTNGISTYPDARDCFDLDGWFQNPACSTQQPRYDTATFPKSLICSIGSTTPLAGHVNWYPVTYTAPVKYSGKATDQDININLFTGGAGYTSTSSGRIHAEFDSRETINNFTTPWWTSFRNAVSNGDSAAAAMIDGRLAVVSGLMGTDCEHDCHVESHPVWGLGLRVRADFADERWAVFARNWGNEGFCSRYQHHLILEPRQLTLRLPWRAGATGVTVASGTVFRANVSGLTTSVQPVPGHYVELTVTLPDPASHGRVHGDLYLSWQGQPLTDEPLVADVPGEVRRPDQGDSAEGRLGRLERAMTPAQREIFERALPPQDATARDAAPVGVRRLPPGPPTPLARVAFTSVPDHETTAADVQRLKALLAAYGGTLPGLDVDAKALGLESEVGTR